MPIIGIITRCAKSDEGHNIGIIYSALTNSILKNGAIPIGIIPSNNYKTLINMCDGIILQGGDDLEEYDLEIVKYLYDIDKPTLGICLGMQIMGILFDGELIDINNHKTKLNFAHKVIIKRDSILYEIFNTDIINVNSRHTSALNSTNLEVIGISQDNVIEAIEAKSKKFFVGVQWHPENMIDYDEQQNNLFKCFINICI